ncbi:MAG: hypothetical protein U0414_23470 [Polyangiaceae bacterium]
MSEPTRMEYERRWLLPASAVDELTLHPSRRAIDDRYLDCGRLRVRRIVESATGRTAFKLTKKWETSVARAIPIKTILLSAAEHDALRALPGRDLAKVRCTFDRGADVFAVDVFSGALAGLVLASIEAESLAALDAIGPPPLALRETTEDAFFSGGALCRLDQAALLARLEAFLP